MRRKYTYPAIFRYDPAAEISVDFPDLEVATSGISERDAIDSAKELLLCVLTGLFRDGGHIPDPTPMEKVEIGENEKVALMEVEM